MFVKRKNAKGPATRPIGIGIGNAAAHELGHQMAYKVRLIMDCNQPDAGRPCAGRDTHVFELYGWSDWEYTHVFSDIHWQIPDSVCAVHQFFDKDYRDTASKCVSDFTR
jgi:hypothetical protein